MQVINEQKHFSIIFLQSICDSYHLRSYIFRDLIVAKQVFQVFPFAVVLQLLMCKPKDGCLLGVILGHRLDD